MNASRKSYNIAAICVALVVGCATGAAIDNLVVPARAAPGATYDYEVLDIQASFGIAGGNAEQQAAVLKKYGAEGWRVVGALGNKVYLERELSGP
ncbi:MAG: hypothetical protein R6X02_26915 [Enhygromyxa sp.]